MAGLTLRRFLKYTNCMGDLAEHGSVLAASLGIRPRSQFIRSVQQQRPAVRYPHRTRLAGKPLAVLLPA